jgi:hypothetical protein
MLKLNDKILKENENEIFNNLKQIGFFFFFFFLENVTDHFYCLPNNLRMY